MRQTDIYRFAMALLHTLLGFGLFITVAHGKCYFAGKPYEENEYFVFKSCDGYCRCTNTGYFNCSTVCKISTDECKADEKEITVKYLSPLATRCVCEARKCLNKPPLPTMKPGKKMCIINGKSYEYDKTFVPDSCQGFCRCIDKYSANCTSLCPTQRTECAPLMNAIYETSRVLLNSNCSCTTKRCVEDKLDNTDIKKTPDPLKNSTCSIDGEVYPFGTLFVPNSCAGLCRCISPTSMQCAPLCTPKIVKCGPGERKLAELQESPLNWRCSCPVKKCVKRRREMQKLVTKALSETPSRFKCNIKGKTYRYRQTFVPDTCEGFCQCSGRNRMECEPLCPTSGAECAPHQERRTQTKRVLLNPKCSCEVEECVGEEPSENHEHDRRAAVVPFIKKCKVNGKEYAFRKTFVPDNCKGFCQCTGETTMKCSIMCPPQKLKCASDEKEVTIYNTVLLNKRCQCPQRKCVKKPATCIVEGKSYNYDKTFVPDSCRGYCKCNGPMSIQCLPLCPLFKPSCAPNEKLVSEEKRVILNPKCSCQVQLCAKVKMVALSSAAFSPNEPVGCKINGRTFIYSRTFVPDSCEGYCKCTGPRTMDCSELCPGSPDSCTPDEDEEIMSEKVILNPKCSCTFRRCVKTTKEKKKSKENSSLQVLTQMKTGETCTMQGKQYAFQKTFVPDSCQGYCKCTGKTTMKCTPLCPSQKHNPSCNANERVEHVQAAVIINPKCLCRMKVCVPKRNENEKEGVCKVNGKTYRSGKTFVPDTCRGYCQCKSTTSMQCSPLCPQQQLVCSANQVRAVVTRKVLLNIKCSCEVIHCVPQPERLKLGFCTVMDKKYKIKRTFVPNSCRGFCQCNGPSSMKCTPLCPQKKITCAAGEKKIVATTKVILNPRCTCEILKCVRKKSTFVSLWENLFGGKSRS